MVNFYRNKDNPARWVVSPSQGDEAASLSQQLKISPLLAGIIISRLKSSDVDEVRKFLSPNLSDLNDPGDLPDMEIAATRLAEAIDKNQKIVIYGDYDTDGVTSSAVLVRIIAALGIQADHYLPSRMEEGYGISLDFVDKAAQNGVDLVVTVDCGSVENERIGKLVESGVDVIVTDHHEPGDGELPNALAIVNPKRHDSKYPFTELTGVGVAFKLAWAVSQKVIGTEKVGERLQKVLLELLQLVAIGTIADVAPLTHENRVLVSFGLRSIVRPIPGIAALCRSSKVDPKKVSARDIGFRISPRLNAAGRMGDATLALDLLLEDAPDKADSLAAELDNRNRERQDLCRRLVDEACEEAEKYVEDENCGALVIAREGWHEGVIGIVAGRICERYNLPTAVIAINGDKAKSSARSVDGVNLYAALAASSELFTRFGGHEMAAGFSLPTENIETLRKELSATCFKAAGGKKLSPNLAIDAEVRFADIDAAVATELSRLAPFGAGNEEPVLLCRNISVAGDPKLMGRDQKHFWFNAAQDKRKFRAVVFNHTDWLEEMDDGIRNWDIVFKFTLNDFHSPARAECVILDMRPAEA